MTQKSSHRKMFSQSWLAARQGAPELSSVAPQRTVPRIVVLGGGVAGLTAAYELRRRLGDRGEVVLISTSDHFVLGPNLLREFFERDPLPTFNLPQALGGKGIVFTHAHVDRIEPELRIVVADGANIGYDYLLIATGPWVERSQVPGVVGLFSDSHTILSEESVNEASRTIDSFLAEPGSAVVGIANKAGYVSPAYEFVLWLDYTLRKRGTRDLATLTFVTPEPQLGAGIPSGHRTLERLFSRRKITTFTTAVISRTNRDFVYLQHGVRLPTSYCMIMPAFRGVPGIWHSSGLTDDQGFVPVDKDYRHRLYPEIFAAGVAADLDVHDSEPLPKTGYLATVRAKEAARNLAGAIEGTAQRGRTHLHLTDLRILDGGDAGLLVVGITLIGRSGNLTIPLPGRTAYHAKRLLLRYLLWKFRTGRSNWP